MSVKKAIGIITIVLIFSGCIFLAEAAADFSILPDGQKVCE